MRLNQNNQKAKLEELCGILEGTTDCLHAIYDQEHNIIEVTYLDLDGRTPEDLILWCVDHAARLEVLSFVGGRCTYCLYPTRKGGFKK